MQIAIHLGAHCTDEGRIHRALSKNKDLFTRLGIAVPSTRAYRQLLPRVAQSLGGAEAGQEAEQVILDAILEGGAPERVVLSHDDLMCFPVNAVTDRGFYPNAGLRISAYRNLFPEYGTEFFLALRNPATMIPELIQRVKNGTYESVMGSISPISLNWAPVVRRIVETLPDVQLTIWCNEDLPLIWPEVLRAIGGLTPGDEIDGEYDFLATIMAEDGLAALRGHFATRRPADIAQRRRSTEAYLARYALSDAIEMEVNLPGWSAKLVEAISAAYEDDCDEIAGLDQVTFISP